jgi:flagellar biogenesis protein FliO
MKTAIIILGLLPVVAFADPRIETLDRGDAVEIIAHDVTAANTTLIPVRSRLEIAVANKPAPINVPSSDKTIVISELDNKTLSVKTAFERSEMKNLAVHAKAMQIGPDLHIIIPRAIPAAGTTIELPDPTMANVPSVVKVELPEPPKPEVKAEVKAEAPKTEEPKPEAKTEPKTEEPKAAATIETKPAPVADKPLPTKPHAERSLEKEAESPMSKAKMLGIMAIVAIGCGFWLLKKRKKQASNESSIEVLAQHSIGAKAKVVWIAAGGREMVLAVTPQGVRMLSSWEKAQSISDDRSACGDAENHFAAYASEPQGEPVPLGYTENGKRTRLPTAQVVDAGMPIPMRAQTQSSPMVDRASPAVAGLLKLRAQTMRPVPQVDIDDEDPMLDDDVRTEDVEADALWAREILAATKATNPRAGTVRGARR